MRDNSTIEVCPRDDIAAYVDGELSREAASLLERHIDTCDACAGALRDQRQMLTALTASLDADTELSLPADFSKRVVSNAESSVAGLRRPNEILTAVCISSALLIFVLFAFGSETWSIFSTLGVAGEKLLTLGGFILKIAGNLAFGIAVVFRSLATHSSAELVLILLSVFVFGLFLFVSSKWLWRRSIVNRG